MDIDRYTARHRADWQRLAELTARGRRRVRQLTPAEVDELLSLYQRTSSHLSYARTHLRDPALINELTGLVADANGVIYGKRARSWQAVTRFVALTFPGAVYAMRRQVLLAALVFFLPAIVMAAWLVNDPDSLALSGSESVRQFYVEDQFEQYYSEQPSVLFFTEVTTNNVRVSFMAYALGAVSGGLGSIWILFQNGIVLGVVSAWMITAGDAGRFFGFILPHGALELSSIVIAGAAGIRLGWSAVAPGDRTRLDAFREEGLRSVTVVLGLSGFFVAAGLVEGFITGSGLPTPLRVGVGLALWSAVVAYLVVQGRAAADRGITGLLGEQPRRWADEPVRFADDVAGLVPGRLE